jgi:hypothetical protein
MSLPLAVLEDEVGWLEAREGVPGLLHPQDPQDPPPPLRDPILRAPPPRAEHAAVGGQQILAWNFGSAVREEALN